MAEAMKIVVPDGAFDHDSPSQAARDAVARAAYERQLPQNRKPAAPKMRYRVVYLGSLYKNGDGEDKKGIGITHEVTAANEVEAWAKYCDLIKSWPSPKKVKRTIECLGPVVYGE